MDVAQMLAHCSVPYEMVYETRHPRPNFLMKFILKSIVRKIVTSPKPYKRNAPTAPALVVNGTRHFEAERTRLIQYVAKTQQLGEHHFDHKVSRFFGSMSKDEWNTLFYKHVDHHLQQFGV